MSLPAGAKMPVSGPRKPIFTGSAASAGDGISTASDTITMATMRITVSLRGRSWPSPHTVLEVE